MILIFLKNNKIWKKIEELMGINFERRSPFLIISHVQQK